MGSASSEKLLEHIFPAMLRWEGELFFTGLTTLRVVQRSPCFPPCHQRDLEEKQPPPWSSDLFQGDLLPQECCFPKREAALLSKCRSSPLTLVVLGKGGFSLIYQGWEKQVKALRRGRKQFSSCLWSFWSKSHLFLRWRIMHGWFLAVWVEVLMQYMFFFPCGMMWYFEDCWFHFVVIGEGHPKTCSAEKVQVVVCFTSVGFYWDGISSPEGEGSKACRPQLLVSGQNYFTAFVYFHASVSTLKNGNNHYFLWEKSLFSMENCMDSAVIAAESFPPS